jgi:plasmid stabilization system protein ParE
MEVILSPLAEKKLNLLLEFLDNKWGANSKLKFLEKLEKEFELLESHPFRCKATQTYPNLFNCIVTKQTSAIYRVNKLKSTIEVVTLFDNRQNPEKLKEEIKKHFG